jgi:DNA helicase HerA-like ATPase
MVSGLSIPIPTREPGPDEMRIVEFEMIGEVPAEGRLGAGEFRRGISTSPGLGGEVFTATQADLELVYQRRSEHAVEIGRLQQNRSVPAYVVVDDLLGKHYAVVGTTGTGKSCAVSLLLHAIIEHHPNAHIIVLDPHAEYANAFQGFAENIEPDDLLLPHWLFNFEEIVEIAFGAEARDLVAETTILRELIQKCKVRFMGVSEQARTVTVDTPVPYKMGDMMRLLDQTMGRLEHRNDLSPYQRVKSRLIALQSDRRFSFMFPGTVVVRDNLADILSRIFRVPVEGKPISILNLSGVPSEVLNVVVSVLCRMTFDFALWSDQQVPLLLVCEEAHRYAPASITEGFEPTKRALARIAKEGRKYGISLGVISQRPSELATSVLSQCNTLFAMRMTSERDQDYLRAAMSEATGGLLDSLPSLGNGEAIAVGEGVAVPMRLIFNQLAEERRPRSGTARFSDSWRDVDDSRKALEMVVARWRQQRR